MKRKLKQSDIYLFQLVLGKSDHLLECYHTIEGLYPNFSQIAELLIVLTRKYAHFKWSDTHQRAFEYLKDSLTAVSLLVYPDSNLYTDASDTCIDARLT